MKARNIATAIATALKDTPVVLVYGARQTGKTTSVKGLVRMPKATYFTPDDHRTPTAAPNDPVGFVASLGDFAAVDEVQNAPNIFRIIKASVDRDRRPGRFLLTGSANMPVLPRMVDSLADRLEIITLHPFAQDELAGRPQRLHRHAVQGEDPVALHRTHRSRQSRKEGVIGQASTAPQQTKFEQQNEQ